MRDADDHTSGRLRSGNQDLSDELGFGRGSGVVNVVFDVEVVTRLNFLIGDHLENATGSFWQIGVGTSQNKTAVLAALEFCVL